uniref:Extracellular matrix protein 1-like n=1 Tax=Gouania willdenowi TaxID=441366 RepID=A0A8C5GDX6_GOUWI
MDSTWTLFWATFLALVLLSSASEDEYNVEQREVTFDFEKLLEGQPSFGPRSMGGPPILNYPVQFPLSRPTSDNLQAICLHGNHRPRYPTSYFPDSGFGQQRRRASAVNNVESWFDSCCERNQTSEKEMTLCCATQAWELSVQLFCEEDSSVKDRLFHCCWLKGSRRLNCFNNDAPNPNYDPTEVVPVTPLPANANFTFDPSRCTRTQMALHSGSAYRRKTVKKLASSQNIDINFPPGRPSADTVGSLCSHQKLRPVYNIKCIPAVGYEWLARQAKTVNRIEKGFKKCCKKKKGLLTCADQKWRDELNRFCVADDNDFHCCSAEDRSSCFQSTSPDPHYNSTSASEELSLGNICVTHKIIMKKFSIGFPLKKIVRQCCPLSKEDRTTCSFEKVVEMSKSLCSSKKKISNPAVRRCCELPSHETPHCVSDVLMDAVTKAADVLRQKKRKICPLS